MNSFKLPGFTISVEGHPYQIKDTVESLFHMFPTTKQQADVHLSAVAVKNVQYDKILPLWLLDSINRHDIELNPLIFEGPEGQTSVGVMHGNLLCCAWTSSENKQINYIACSKNRNLQKPIFQAVLNPIFREIMLLRGILLLHSAGVLSPKGLGLVFIAPSGGGKTTTALSMIRNGSKLLGDDLLAIKPSTIGNTVFGIPEPMNLTNKTIGFFKETDIFPKPDIINSGYRKKSIKPQRVYGDNCLVDQCRMHLLYFINKSTNGPAIKPINSSEGIKKLILSHAFTKNQIAGGNSISKLCELMSQVGIYELYTGSNPRTLGKWLIRNCSTHAGH
jgi:hypothetical protein